MSTSEETKTLQELHRLLCEAQTARIESSTLLLHALRDLNAARTLIHLLTRLSTTYAAMVECYAQKKEPSDALLREAVAVSRECVTLLKDGPPSQDPGSGK